LTVNVSEDVGMQTMSCTVIWESGSGITIAWLF